METGAVRDVELEVIAESAEDAAAAERGGADRIELVADLHLDGVTPEERVIRDAVRAVDIPVYVMIRPRAGDAVYTKSELAIMVESIAMAKEAGAAGLVLGVSRPDGFVDEGALGRLLEGGGLPATFHRAFDAVPPPQMGAALDILARLPWVERVLTSSGFPDADAGRFALRRLVEHRPPVADLDVGHVVGAGPGPDPAYGSGLNPKRSEDRGPDRRLSIMPGGGVTAANLARIVRDTGVREIHVGRAARAPMPGGSGWGRGTQPVLEGAVRRLKQTLLDAAAVAPGGPIVDDA